MSTFTINTASLKAHELQTYTALDFSGGLDVKTSPFKRAIRKDSKYLTRAVNVVLDNDGVVRRRPGFALVNASATLQAASKPITGGFHYQKSDGTSQVIIAWNTNLYKLDLSGTTTVTSIKSGLTTEAVYSFAVYNDTLFIANGIDVPMQYDGTTVTNLGGSSPATARVFVAHGNRLFATATATPSRLFWSKLNNPLDWSGTDDAGFMDVNPNDGSTISTLVPSNQELVILKGSRPYRLQGIGPATGYTVADHLVPASGSVGTPYTRGATFAQNDVWYVSPVGLHRLSATQQFGDLKESFPSEPIEPIFTSGQEFLETNSGIPDWEPDDAVARPVVIYEPGTQAIYVSVRTNLAETDWGMDQLLVYDCFTKGWVIWRPQAEITAMWLYTEPDGSRRLMVGAMSDMNTGGFGGIVQKLDPVTAADVTDEGTNNYTSTAAHTSNLGGRGIKSPRHLTMYFGELLTDTITIDITSYLNTTISQTQSLVLSNVSQGRVDVSIVGEYFEVVVRDTANFRWAGYRMDWRLRRLIQQT